MNKKYVVCVGLAMSLENEVNELLNQGYVLYGNPFAKDFYICQALVLPEVLHKKKNKNNKERLEK